MFQNHQQNCSYFEVNCEFEECEEMIKRKDLQV